MDTITYSLKGGQEGSKDHHDQNYEDLKTFTAEVLNVSRRFVGTIMGEFQEDIRQNSKIQNSEVRNSEIKNEVDSYEKYAFELLMLGTLWRIHAGRACRSVENRQKIMTGLRLFAMLSKHSIQGKNSKNMSSYPLELNVENLDKLLKFLEATGEFGEELKRFKVWREFLIVQEPEKISEYLRNILIFADWFKKCSKLRIANYSHSEKKFLNYLKLMGCEISGRSFEKGTFKKDSELRATASGTSC